jgi:hypothetical protein
MIDSAIIGKLMHLNILIKISEMSNPIFCNGSICEKPIIKPKIIAIR